MNRVFFGDCRDSLRSMAADGVKVQTCVTSPPYFGLRDYGHSEQIGMEETPEQYIAALVEVFRCVRDVLADDGTLWINIGDSYASKPNGPAGTPKEGSVAPHVSTRTAHARRSSQIPAGFKHKDLIGIPWMLAFALRTDGWYLRQDIIWHKPNPMPESITDRCTKAHEYVFLLSKCSRYFYDHEAVKEPAVGDPDAPRNRWDTKTYVVPGQKPQKRASRRPSVKRGGFAGKTEVLAGEGRNSFRAVVDRRNRRSVWTIATRPYAGAHFAVFPPALVEPCILAGSRPGDTVLDPFMGSGTTAAVAIEHGRQFIGCELNQDYKPLQDERIAEAQAAVAAAAEEAKRAAAQLQLFEEAA
jgi:DNA modification methylase